MLCHLCFSEWRQGRVELLKIMMEEAEGSGEGLGGMCVGERCGE